jgi:cold shock CspA family protein
MEVPMEVSFHNMDKSTAVENLIYKKVGKLERVCDHIISCRVTLDQEQKRSRKGNVAQVRIDLRIPPGHEIVIKRESREGTLQEQLPMLVHRAFNAAQRKAKKLKDKQEGQVKTHPQQQLMAVVSSLYPEKDHGFLKSQDGEDIYFHRNSVLNDKFDRMQIGTGVTFEKEVGEKGLQASSVHIVDKPGVSSPKTEEETIEPPLGWQS